MELQTPKQPLPSRRIDTAVTLVNQPLQTDQEDRRSLDIRPDRKPFIEANTNEVGLSHLEKDCIIPVFAKDNESTINHQEFIGVMQQCIQQLYGASPDPEIRVSHIVKGRIPSAIAKPAKDLLEHEKTLYYERMAFSIELENHSALVCGNRLNLCLGGVRAYNHENLYGKKTMERFKVFIGYRNTVCTNLCVSSDGFVEELKASNLEQLRDGILKMIEAYNKQQHVSTMEEFGEHFLTESQFAQLLGKARLYQFLPPVTKMGIPTITFHDSHIHAVAKEYYFNPNFCREEDGTIDLWRLYNLFTGANKSSYIDTFLDRSVNAFSFVQAIKQGLETRGSNWFIN